MQTALTRRRHSVWVEKYLERPERDVQKLATMQLRERKSAKDNITDIEISRHSVDKVQTWLKQSIERSEPWDVSEVSIFYLFSFSLKTPTYVQARNFMGTDPSKDQHSRGCVLLTCRSDCRMV